MISTACEREKLEPQSRRDRVRPSCPSPKLKPVPYGSAPLQLKSLSDDLKTLSSREAKRKAEMMTHSNQAPRLESDLSAVSPEEAKAQSLLSEVTRFRRMGRSETSCFPGDCPGCAAPHLPKILKAIQANQKIRFVLPAFPGKSPNPAKVLGVLPDMAEREALTFLNGLCERIQERYSPGAEIIICSDGRVFNDLIGIRDEDISAYQRELDRLLKELDLKNISTFDLDAVYSGNDYDLRRQDLMEKYGRSPEELREMVKRGGNGTGHRQDKDAHRHYCGTTRFLVEDAHFPGQTKSKNALQKECRAKAYEVMRRSNAWTDLIAEKFPDAIRLSIHPQDCSSTKLGIQLVGASNWMTPWHGVAVDIGSNFVLMKRSQAEELGATLILDSEGKPSHFKLEKIEV